MNALHHGVDRRYGHRAPRSHHGGIVARPAQQAPAARRQRALDRGDERKLGHQSGTAMTSIQADRATPAAINRRSPASAASRRSQSTYQGTSQADARRIANVAQPAARTGSS